MYCNRLHACWSTQLRLTTLPSSLIARQWVGLQIILRSRLKDLSHRSLEPDAQAVSGPLGLHCWISFALGFRFMYC